MSRRTHRPTTRPETPGQLGLFGGDPAPAPTPGRVPTAGPAGAGVCETNDMDLITAIAGNASRDLYVLVGANERLYVRTDGPEGRDIARVPRYEEAVVHQLLRRGWLTLGGRTKELGCGAATLTGTAVHCPVATRTRVQRWAALSRPPSWTVSPAATRPALRVVQDGQT